MNTKPTNIQQVHILPATMQDLDEIMKIYEIAKAYMKAKGNPNQWNGAYPEREMLAEDIDKQQLYVCKSDNKVQAVFAFIIGDDPTYAYIEDGEWLNAQPYGTIHRIASRGEVKGIFKKCLDFCLEKIRDIRIDTHEDNKVMQHLLDKHGFQKCGIIYLQSGAKRLAYQYCTKAISPFLRKIHKS